ncbi:antitoxin [Brevundimonas intermedia]|uniref:Antitoxin n=1 Tax=Brevundimonas intermedia TaxID=74315 RepID=A0ABQ5T6Y2_9CAUL|nr:type II toxin-antitoxin system VapB family antitoxin [Brevundimonas intermedia]GLK47128.1 antitoxin [Brevundimonas intermedia]
MSAPLKATVFKSNRSQAVRLPKAVAFPDDVKELRVIKEGKSLRLVPVDALWDDFLDQPGISDSDWPDRDQPEMQKREDW